MAQSSNCKNYHVLEVSFQLSAIPRARVNLIRKRGWKKLVAASTIKSYTVIRSMIPTKYPRPVYPTSSSSNMIHLVWKFRPQSLVAFGSRKVYKQTSNWRVSFAFSIRKNKQLCNFFPDCHIDAFVRVSIHFAKSYPELCPCLKRALFSRSLYFLS